MQPSVITRGHKIKLALLFSIPYLLMYAAYWWHHSPDLIPTGYIQYDNVGYAAYAKQYLDEGQGLGYSNPFNEGPGYHAIYFQTQNLFLVLLMKLGLSPALALCLFSFLFAVAAIYCIITLYYHLFPKSGKGFFVPLLLVWGGGLLVISSALVMPWRPQPNRDWLDSLFYLDPAHGWWGLNFGRPLFFGVESYYHFLFVAVLLCCFRKQWIGAALLALVLSFSHPFTGIHLYLVLLAWLAVEKLIIKNTAVPGWLLMAVPALTLLHLWYYLYFLPQYPDHKSVSTQYAANWNYRFYHFIPAYILTGTLFLGAFYQQGFRKFFNDGMNRFFFCMALVSMLLSNHELFIKPMQPIHFARGYEWTAYFFLGLPFLRFLLSNLKKQTWALALFTALFLLDNFTWVLNYVREKRTQVDITHINAEQEEVLQLIGRHATNETMVVGEDEFIPYLSTVRSKAYPWYSHPYTTPFSEEKRKTQELFFGTGIVPGSWSKKHLLIIVKKQPTPAGAPHLPIQLNGKILFEGRNYQLIEVHPDITKPPLKKEN